MAFSRKRFAGSHFQLRRRPRDRCGRLATTLHFGLWCLVKAIKSYSTRVDADGVQLLAPEDRIEAALAVLEDK